MIAGEWHGEDSQSWFSYGPSGLVPGGSVLPRPHCSVRWLLCGCSGKLTSPSPRTPQCLDLFSGGRRGRHHPEPWYWYGCLGQGAHCLALALPLLLAPPDHCRDGASLKGGQRGLSRAHNLSDSHRELPRPLPLSAGPLPRKACTMCNRFVGTWKLVSSENFDDYMKELGEKCFVLVFFLSFLWEWLFFILCFAHGWCLLPGHKSTLITFLA